MLQRRGENNKKKKIKKKKGFSETSSFLNCESQGCHPAHPGVNEAEGTHADVPELTNAECTFQRNSPGSSPVQRHQLCGCLTPGVCTDSQYQTLSPVSEPPAPFSLSPSTGKAGWAGGWRGGTVYSRQNPQTPANRFSLPWATPFASWNK